MPSACSAPQPTSHPPIAHCVPHSPFGNSTLFKSRSVLASAAKPKQAGRAQGRASSPDRAAASAGSPARRPAGRPPPADRFALNCPHFETCSGCTIDRQLEQPPIAFRANDLFREQYGYDNFSLTVGAVKGWRHRAKLAFRGAAGRGKLGLFREGALQCLLLAYFRIPMLSIA